VHVGVLVVVAVVAVFVVVVMGHCAVKGVLQWLSLVSLFLHLI
jgi:hypothetical protein